MNERNAALFEVLMKDLTDGRESIWPTDPDRRQPWDEPYDVVTLADAEDVLKKALGLTALDAAVEEAIASITETIQQTA